MDTPKRVDRSPEAAADPETLDHLIPTVYGELRTIAHRIRRSSMTDTMQTTALVHESYLKLLDERRESWSNRSHLVGVAATAMRRILMHAIEAKRRLKRGGAHLRVPLDEDAALAPAPDLQWLAIDEALGRLASFDARKARLVELRLFAGLPMAEVASALGVSEVTAKRDWAAAKLWILREIDSISGEGADGGS